MKIIIPACLIILLSSCTPIDNNYCPEITATKAHNQLGIYYDAFYSYVKLYETNNWSIYPEDIKRLEEVKADTLNLEVPECLDKSKFYLLKIMDTSISGLTMYMLGDPSGVLEQMTESTKLTTLANEELSKVRRCLPNCTREKMQ